MSIRLRVVASVFGLGAAIVGASVAAASGLFVADQDALGGPGAILEIDQKTGAQSIISSGGLFSHPTALVFVGKHIVVADQDAAGGTGALIRVDPRTGVQAVISSGGNFINPGGLTVDSAGRLIVADRESGRIIAVDLNRTRFSWTPSRLNRRWWTKEGTDGRQAWEANAD